MAITEEQFEDIQDSIDLDDVHDLRDLAHNASLPNLFQELDKLYEQAKKSLESGYDASESYDALEELSETVEGLQTMVVDASEALDKLYEFLSGADTKLTNTLYADEDL